MKKILLTSLLFFSAFCISSSAQNLVLNGGLENIITCPPGMGVFSSAYINNWTKPSIGSTDYYSYNCLGLEPVAQIPHSGASYFGIIAYNYSGEYREYATGQLSSSLTGGVQYTVEFYVSLGDGYIQAVNELGAYLSAAVLGPYANALHISVTPQVESTTLLGSDSTWMLVSGTFVASGGEQYITIGNFNDDANTTVTQVGNIGSYGAYYFVDDVSVIEIPTGINRAEKENISVYPNPVSTQLIIDSGRLEIKSVGIYDRLGQKVISREFQTPDLGLKTQIDVPDLTPGIYFLSCNGSAARAKFVVHR